MNSSAKFTSSQGSKQGSLFAATTRPESVINEQQSAKSKNVAKGYKINSHNGKRRSNRRYTGAGGAGETQRAKKGKKFQNGASTTGKPKNEF